MSLVSILIIIALATALILLVLPRASTGSTNRLRAFIIGAVRWVVVVVAGALALAAGIAILFGGAERVFRELQDIGCVNC